MKSFGVVPAAGHSKRMGRPKLLLPWGDGLVIDSVLEAWRQSRATQVVVVVRQADVELRAACEKHDVEIATPAADPAEMRHSAACGLEYVRRRFSPTNDDVWLLAPADTPALSAATIDALLAAHDAQHSEILVPVSRGRRGHPVLLPWRLAAEIDGLPPGQGVNSLMASHALREIQVSGEGLLDDLDTPADYQRLRNRYNR